MEKPLISICIPTYNRALFLKECLESITRQFSNKEITEKINIFILDNQSKDNTEEIAKNFVDSFNNIKYIKDSQNRNIIQGIIAVSSLADGEYLWVFSDDDLHSKNSLETIIKFIYKNKPDIIFSNLSGFSDSSPIKYPNLLKATTNNIINSRKEFFEYLNKKFYTNIDYYTTLCSNLIIKKSIFDNKYYILEQYKDKLDMFPLPSLFLYSNDEYIFGVLSEQIVLNRGNNVSWGHKNEIKHFFYRDRLWRDYYKKIILNNRKYLPKHFILKTYIKNIIRLKELIKILSIIILKKIGVYQNIKKIIIPWIKN